MRKNKYDQLFNPNQETNRLSFIFFSHCDEVKNDEEGKKSLREAFSRAYKIAQNRELKEASKGILR